MFKIGSFGKTGKKKIIILVVIILLLVVGGVFYWQKGQREIKGSPEDYIIIETAEGKFVINEKAGLTVKVPEGWIDEKVEVRCLMAPPDPHPEDLWCEWEMTRREET